MTDTSKTNQSYSYAYSSSKELNELDYPNTLELHQTWSSKMLDLLTVTDATQQTTYLSSDATYNANEQMSEYDFSVNAGQNAFSEGYDLAYDSLGRLSTMETDSTSRTVTHGYDAGNGQLTSLAFSDLGTYSIDYLTNGNIDTITYPNSQGEETYTYGGGKGRLSQIEYPNDDTLEFDWNDKDEVSRITYTDYTTQTETRYTMTYNPNHEVATLTQSIDSVQQYVWTFSWAPNGLEKAVKAVNGQPVLTQDFTTDQSGRILSMTYDTTGEVGYDGELYFHYDHFGNTTLLTDEEGDPVFSAQYNPCRGTTLQTWNTNNLEIINLGQGRSGTISLPLPANVTALVTSSRTITISEEVISAFVARYGTDFLACYTGDYGPQSSVNENPDANPCKTDCLQLEQSIKYNIQLRAYWDTQVTNIDKNGCWYEPDRQLNEDRSRKHKIDPFLRKSDLDSCSVYFFTDFGKWASCLRDIMKQNAVNEMKNEVNIRKKAAQDDIDNDCIDYCDGECWKLQNCLHCKEDYRSECHCSG